MKVSELIKHLEDIREKHGDVPCTQGCSWDSRPVTEKGVVPYNKAGCHPDEESPAVEVFFF